MGSNEISPNYNIYNKERQKMEYKRMKTHLHEIQKLHFTDDKSLLFENRYNECHYNYAYEGPQTSEIANLDNLASSKIQGIQVDATEPERSLSFSKNLTTFDSRINPSHECGEDKFGIIGTSNLHICSSYDDNGDTSVDILDSMELSNSIPPFSNFPKEILNLKDFIFQPTPQNEITMCRIVRNRRGVNKSIYPTYHLYLDADSDRHLFLLAARRRKKSISGNYLISCNATDLKRDSDYFVGKLRANLMATNFVVVDYHKANNIEENVQKRNYKGFRRELAGITYDTIRLGFKGPRKMSIIIPGMNHDHQRIEFYKKKDGDSLLERGRMNKMHNLLQLYNKIPIWNEDSHSYVLNFHGRVTQASVKNFQIVHDNDVDSVVMQFGRVSEDIFSMDFSYPLCALQAFGIALSSFDSKLEYE